jgi:hypothetical protein
VWERAETLVNAAFELQSSELSEQIDLVAIGGTHGSADVYNKAYRIIKTAKKNNSK